LKIIEFIKRLNFKGSLKKDFKLYLSGGRLKETIPGG
jgi:hypothetical protein